MQQSVLSMVVEVQPASADRLRRLINALRQQEETTPPDVPKYTRLRQAIPILQFLSMTVCEDNQYDPVLVIECNFDGAPGPFWAQLEALYGSALRDMIRCCRRPTGMRGALYDSVTAFDSRRPIAPFLEAFTVMPAVFHIGNRGLVRGRVEREYALFQRCEQILDDDPSLRILSAVALHERLRAAALVDFPWLDREEQPRISTGESVADYVRLAVFVVLVVLGLALPGILIGLALPSWVFAGLAVMATLWGSVRLGWMKDPAMAVALGRNPAPLFGLLVGFVAAMALLLVLSQYQWHSLTARVVTAALCSMGAMLVVLLAWINALEQADPPQTAPTLDDRAVRAMTRAEDQITQNHMISIVHVKSGLLRAVLIRAGLHGLGYILRIQARDGYLASMRTIHFAHWALISNGGRLMFHSNFDGTWESYLDDFIEKAHAGLTLAWCNGVGFPPTRFLLFEGAANGRAFKTWARHSMTASQFWFSAHRDLTVNQIERQFRVAEGMRARGLAADAADVWARNL